MDKIICVGKNYPAHAEELGEKQPEQPVLFLKPRSSMFQMDERHDVNTFLDLTLPFNDIHHELELVFRVENAKANSPFSAFTLGLDLTRRDLQMKLKKSGQPWEIAKVFANSAVVCPWRSWSQWMGYKPLTFSLSINGSLRQHGEFSQMLWSPESCLQLAESYFPIKDGDLLFSGTPVGVGPLNPGDRLEIKFGEETFAKLICQMPT